jgi:plasmid stability protein
VAQRVRAAQSGAQAEAELRRIVDQMRHELADRAARFKP